jgi:hypothetical protein
MVACDFCGTPAPQSASASTSSDPAALDSADQGMPDEIPLTWVTSIENGRRRVYCERCSRDHLRSIESKLDSEWW